MRFSRRWIAILAVAAVLLTGTAVLLSFLPGGKPIRGLPAGTDIRNGDVVLLGSDTCRGWALKLLNPGTLYAHIALADVENGEVRLLHACPAHGKVVSEPFDVYLLENKIDAILVLRTQSESNAVKAVSFARSAVARQVPFDNAFAYGNGEGMYCTELVLRAWSAAGVDLLDGVQTGDGIMPERVLESTKLMQIFNLKNE